MKSIYCHTSEKQLLSKWLSKRAYKVLTIWNEVQIGNSESLSVFTEKFEKYSHVEIFYIEWNKQHV